MWVIFKRKKNRVSVVHYNVHGAKGYTGAHIRPSRPAWAGVAG